MIQSKKIPCIGGPLAESEMPDFGTQYFLFTAYDANGSQGPLHVYRMVDGEWIADDEASMNASVKHHHQGR